MSVDIRGDKRSLLIEALRTEPQLVVAGGVRDIHGKIDSLELHAALREPGLDLKNNNCHALAYRLNTAIKGLKAFCGEPTGGSSLSLSSANPELAELSDVVLSAGHLGYMELPNPESSLSYAQIQVLNKWRVLRYRTSGTKVSKHPLQYTDVYLYPHPLIAEIQTKLYAQKRKREDDLSNTTFGGDMELNYRDRLIKARKGYRTPDWSVTRHTLEVAGREPHLLPNVFLLGDKHQSGLRPAPLNITDAEASISG